MTLKFSSLSVAAMVAIAACSAPSTPPAAQPIAPPPTAAAPTNPQPTAPESDPVPDPAPNPVETAPTQGANCVTWAAYRPYFADAVLDNNLNALPYMLPGFESGCAFRVGMGLGTSVSILRDGIDLSTLLTTTDPPAETDGPIPWLEWNQVNSEQIDTLVAQGDIVTFYEACVTTGGHASNCEGFPEQEAYVLDDNTACYDGRCLTLMGPHAVYLLSMWPWPEDIYDLPTSFSSAESVARLEYETVPLNQLPADVSTYGFPPEIAQALFGRTVLEEGMRPTEISANWESEPDGLYVVYLTNDGMADDSVGGQRYRLDFVSADGDMQKLVWVGQQHRCLRGDAPGWTTDLCP
ncbi:MAG: hypothetical protein AAFU71_05160 [Cyanobacteria bacterium J06632_22]